MGARSRQPSKRGERGAARAGCEHPHRAQQVGIHSLAQLAVSHALQHAGSVLLGLDRIDTLERVQHAPILKAEGPGFELLGPGCDGRRRLLVSELGQRNGGRAPKLGLVEARLVHDRTRERRPKRWARLDELEQRRCHHVVDPPVVFVRMTVESRARRRGDRTEDSSASSHQPEAKVVVVALHDDDGSRSRLGSERGVVLAPSRNRLDQGHLVGQIFHQHDRSRSMRAPGKRHEHLIGPAVGHARRRNNSEVARLVAAHISRREDPGAARASVVGLRRRCTGEHRRDQGSACREPAAHRSSSTTTSAASAGSRASQYSRCSSGRL